MSSYYKPVVTTYGAKTFGTRSNDTTWKTYTCSICGSTKRMFVQCVPCCKKFNAAWNQDFRAAEEYEYPQALHIGEHPYESSRILSEMEAAKTVLVPGISLSSPERWWSL